MPAYVTDSGYVEELEARPKVGAPGAQRAFYVQDLTRDTTYQVDLAQLTDFLQTEGLRLAGSAAVRLAGVRTLNVDVVDRRRKELAWEGVAVGRLAAAGPPVCRYASSTSARVGLGFGVVAVVTVRPPRPRRSHIR